jgi:hypothetical protein
MGHLKFSTITDCTILVHPIEIRICYFSTGCTRDEHRIHAEFAQRPVVSPKTSFCLKALKCVSPPSELLHLLSMF